MPTIAGLINALNELPQDEQAMGLFGVQGFKLRYIYQMTGVPGIYYLSSEQKSLRDGWKFITEVTD